MPPPDPANPAGVLPPAGDPPPPPEPRPGREIVCEFCDCRLTPVGEYVSLSDRAKKLRDQGSRIEKLTEQIAELERQLTAANAELRELKTPRRRDLLDESVPTF